MQRPRVLVVDDDDGTLQAIAAVLRRDFAVWVARDATHAIAVAEELDWDADVLIVDLLLGNGMRGDEFAALYRTRQRRETPVLVISGAAERLELAEGIDVTAIIHKPFDFEHFARTIWMLLPPALRSRYFTTA